MESSAWTAAGNEKKTGNLNTLQCEALLTLLISSADNWHFVRSTGQSGLMYVYFL